MLFVQHAVQLLILTQDSQCVKLWNFNYKPDVYSGKIT